MGSWMPMSDFAPIALFVYNRPEHVRRTLDALAANELASESDLIVFSDGPKNADDMEAVSAVRRTVGDASGFASVRVIESPVNKGLAASIISGVSKVLEDCRRIIVVEDDLLTSPYFLKFMNKALDFYEDEVKVCSIHGYTPPVDAELPETFFIRGADCWGWATWKRAWDLFESDGRKLLDALDQESLSDAFDFDGAYPFRKMLEDQMAGRNDSWAIRWYASVFLAGGLTLYPGKSLVANIGLDASGAHGDDTLLCDVELSDRPIRIGECAVAEDVAAREALRGFYAKLASLGSWRSRVSRGIKRLSKGVFG